MDQAAHSGARVSSATAIGQVKPTAKAARPFGARAQQKEATRLALIAAARKLFTERGYHDVGVREFVAAAGVTRGALYHHFPGGKEDLFLAVFDDVEREMIAVIAQTRAEEVATDLWAGFRQSIQAYLDAATSPDVRRITLIDGPAVLGWVRWRQLEEGYSLGGLTRALEGAIRERLIRPQPVEPLAHLLLGSIMEAAMLIAHSEQQALRREEVGRALDSLLRGLE